MNDDFINDFEWAVIRLATYQTKRGKPGKLLFATVSLLPLDRPPPLKMKSFERQNLGKSGINIYFRRVVLDSKSAVEWYRSLKQRDSKTPIPSRSKDVEEKLDGKPITISSLIDDPQWPNLGLPIVDDLFTYTTESHSAPFIGNSISKIHRRFGNAEEIKASLFLNDNALTFITRRLHIDLKIYPEYLGSAVLVVPDPIIKKIDNFLIPATEKRGERIFYRFIARAGQILDSLKITFFDKQANLLTNFKTRNIPKDGILDIDKTIAIGTYGYVVTHPIHGVLLHRPPTGFLRQITSNSHLINGIRKVQVPISESPTSPQIEYSVRRTTNVSQHTIGHNLVQQNVNERIGFATLQRKKLADAAYYDQRWFSNDSREEAINFVQSRVSRARQHIMVADPYFGVLQIPQYLLAITSDSVRVTILTSRLAFEGGYSPEISNKCKCEETIKSEDTLSKKIQLFKQEIERVKDNGNTDVDVMVLRGKKSPILHDRFLVVDKQVWFLGNSLNMLGKRASMIIKLPNPDEALYELDKMQKQAETFNDYEQRYFNSGKDIEK